MRHQPELAIVIFSTRLCESASSISARRTDCNEEKSRDDGFFFGSFE
jgi:hypothetical protein